MKRLKQFGLLLYLALLLLPLLSHAWNQAKGQAAQSADNHGAAASPDASIIDGSRNPGLIPDLTAYRLWLLAISADVQGQPDKSVVARQSHLRAAGMSDAEIAAVDPTIARFRSDYDNLLANYNTSAVAGQQPDLNAFLIRRDLLVQQTVATLQSKISLSSSSNWQVHIQSEKRRMKIAKEVK